MQRIVAVYLPFLRLEASNIPLERESEPVALVIAKVGGAVKDERSLQGGTRIDEVNPRGLHLGVRPGQTVAAARAKCTALHTKVIPEGAVLSTLFRIAEALLAFGTTTAVSLEESVVWVDVTGCAHLHSREADPEGEKTLVSSIEREVLALGHKSRIALADGPTIAAAFARYSKGSSIVQKGGNQKAIGALSIHALPLSEDARSWLSALGIRTVLELQKLPRPSLEKRLGENSPEVMQLLLGDDPKPLTAYVPPTVPEEKAVLEYGTESSEVLLFVVKGLIDRLAPRLEGRGMGATHLDIVLGLDRAFAKETPVVTLPVHVATPLSQPADLLRVLRVKVDAFLAPAPILEVTLRATALTPRKATNRHLFIPESKAERALPSLVAELEAELGKERVGRLSIANFWRPSMRSPLTPFCDPLRETIERGLATPNMPRGSLLSGAAEPTRLLLQPIPIQNHPLEELIKQNMIEWWARAPVSRAFGRTFLTDFGATAWVELDEKGERAWIRGWMD